MTSMQPITQSYVEEPSSCFGVPKIKDYHKNSIMDILMHKSPLMAYFAQISGLDKTLDDLETQMTCFAPCREYCEAYWSLFKDNTDHMRARILVLSNVLKYAIPKEKLTQFDIIPSMYRYSSIDVRYQPQTGYVQLNNTLHIVQGDIQAENGVVHLINGIIEPSTDPNE